MIRCLRFSLRVAMKICREQRLRVARRSLGALWYRSVTLLLCICCILQASNAREKQGQLLPSTNARTPAACARVSCRAGKVLSSCCRQISADEDGALCRLSGGYKIVSLIMIFMTKLFEIFTDYYEPEVRCC